MRWLGGPRTRAESDALADQIRRETELRGFGLWAAELPGVAEFAGFVGLRVPSFEAWFTPCVEVGWRLARPYWGFGYASEAATACLAHAFDVLALDEVVSFTVVGNVRSRRVMERIGMTSAGRFDHPQAPVGHELREHLLYRSRRSDGAAPGSSGRA